MKKTILTLFLGASLIAAPMVFSSCNNGNNEENNTGNQDTTATTAPAEQPAQTQPSAPQNVDINLATVGNTMTEMKYDQTELHVPAGATVHLTLTNQATDQSMQHNWVLMSAKDPSDDDIKNVAMDGLKAGKDNDFVTKDDSRVLAHTKIVGPGDKTDITFTAPTDKGNYHFMCTYPGHYTMMKGTLIVE